MSSFIEVYRSFGPRLVHNRTVELEEIAEWMATRSGLNPAEVEMVLKELRAAVIYFGRMGTPLRVPGFGRVRMSIGRRGKFRVNTLPDPVVVRAMNAPGTYKGKILNRGNIGLDDAGFKALWDAEHPEDPMELTGS